MSNTTSQESVLKERVERLGFRVDYLEGIWFDCLVASATESYFGRGFTEEAALYNALREMFPTPISWEMFQRQGLTSTELCETAAREELSAAAPMAEVEAVTAACESCGADSSVELLHEHSSPAAPLIAPPTESAPQKLEIAQIKTKASNNGHKQNGRKRGEDREAAFVALEILLDWIDEAKQDLADHNPDILKLLLVEGVCKTKATMQDFLTDPEIIGLCHDVLNNFIKFNKALWLGQLNCLDKEALPFSVGKDLRLSLSASPGTWEDAAGLLRPEFDRLMEKINSQGADDSGWFDKRARLILPTSEEADAILKDLVSETDKICDRLNPPTNGKPRQDFSSEDLVAKLPDIVRELRWIRDVVTETWTWAVTFGKLRKLQAEAQGGKSKLPGWDQFCELLDPGYAPTSSHSYAKHFGYDPELPLLEKAELDLYAAMPTEEIVVWLSKYGHLQGLTPDCLAALIRNTDNVTAFCAVQEAELSGKSLKKARERLRKAQERLNSPDLQPVEVLPSPTSQRLRSVSRATKVYVNVEKARERALGKRILVVSNRTESDLPQKLGELLDATFEWDTQETRRLDSCCTRVSNGSYDIVLAASGFVGHKVDFALKPVCDRYKVTYLRVGKGKPQTIIDRLAGAR